MNKEVDNYINNRASTSHWDGEKTVTLNITDYEIKETDGKVILQVFTEGSHDWTYTRDGYGNVGIGRTFAYNLIWHFDATAKMYGVEMNYEFYENGERITLFTKIN
ncbi:hypothetical protein [Metabacillus sediminilitoris]|uniref:Uncharacterized protein n=1 Tax=Metabacillus sediminilitoris TaxID=2567941 RepID=A0A4S4BJX5_9BACI|nr:hypothetical protein [Metabacillus sediminilitoris]QGQ46628.1 hypothetical protein GMB29_16225 [Metabacillus sediminilitoris]THF74026.1 hypothetical protein E6W99_25880 [Metabacillus sediminilitoris]